MRIHQRQCVLALHVGYVVIPNPLRNCSARKGDAGETRRFPRRLCAGFVFVYRRPAVFIPTSASHHLSTFEALMVPDATLAE
jgi:hypothetical protein